MIFPPSNYEHIVKAHQSTPQAGQNQVPDEVKFQVVGQFTTHLLSIQYSVITPYKSIRSKCIKVVISH